MSDNKTAVDRLEEPTALQQIIETEEQASAILEDLDNLPVEEEDRWAFTLEMDVDDLPQVREEVAELTDDGGE